MDASIITHPGIVEQVGTHSLLVRIVQTTSCAACSIKGHCSSAEQKEKLITVYLSDTSAYQPGDSVTVLATTRMGLMAVFWAFLLPLVWLFVSLFVLKHSTGNDAYAALGGLLLLLPYYLVLWLNRKRMKKHFLFQIQPNK